jgi:hypothetical protein
MTTLRESRTRSDDQVFGDAVIGGESADDGRPGTLSTEMIAMPHALYAALDVSLEKTTICVMAADGAIAREAVVVTDPGEIAACLAPD